MHPGTDAAAGRVLVVDDEKPLAQMVATVHTGPGAVDAARSGSVDVVVLDLGSPVLDRIEVRRRFGGLPVLRADAHHPPGRPADR